MKRDEHRKIFKYTLAITDLQMVAMPIDAEILSVQDQHGALTLWAIVDPSAPVVATAFAVYGTGHPMYADREHRHVGTVQMHEGSLVWHVFQIIVSAEDRS